MTEIDIWAQIQQICLYTKTNARTDTFRQYQIGFMSGLLCALCLSIVPSTASCTTITKNECTLAHNRRYPTQSKYPTHAGKAKPTAYNSNKIRRIQTTTIALHSLTHTHTHQERPSTAVETFLELELDIKTDDSFSTNSNTVLTTNVTLQATFCPHTKIFQVWSDQTE